MLFSFSACDNGAQDGGNDGTDGSNSGGNSTESDGDTTPPGSDDTPGDTGTLPKGDLSGVTFEDATFDYDGKTKKIEVKNLPEGATVKYTPRNTKSGAGTLVVTATVSMEGCEDRVLVATLRVRSPEIEEKPIPVKKFNFTAATYNIHRALGSGDSPVTESVMRSNIRKLAADIKAIGADVVGLQEVDVGTARSHDLNMLELLAEEAGYSHYSFYPAVNVDGGQYGVAILSKHEIIESQKYELSNRTDKDAAGKYYEPRVLGRVKINIEGVDVNFFVTHITRGNEDYYGGANATDGLSADVRMKQFEDIAEIVKQYDNFMIAGDYNTGDTRLFTAITGLGAKAANAGYDMLVTHPGTNSHIDNIIYSIADDGTNWKFELPGVSSSNNSDHNLLYITGAYYRMEVV